jgi:hypothetical protein
MSDESSAVAEAEIEFLAAANDAALTEIAAEHDPQTAMAAISAKYDYDYEDAKRVLKAVIPTTNGPGRRSMNYCLLCNPEWNGKYGEDGTEAIAKYEVDDEPGVEQISTGWHGVCEECAYDLRHSVDLVPVSGHDDHELFADAAEAEPPDVACDHPSWTKVSLVTEASGYDLMQCEGCEIYGKRYGPGQDIEVVGFERP